MMELLRDLRSLALDPPAAVVVFLHVAILMLVPPAVPQVTVLKVGIDVEVVVHAVSLVRFQLLGEVALQLLQLLPGQEVGLGEDHLEGKRARFIFGGTILWLKVHFCSWANIGIGLIRLRI